MENTNKRVGLQKERLPGCGRVISSYKIIEEKKFETPQMNSVLRQKQEIESIRAAREQISTEQELTPNTLNVIMPKVCQRLNVDTRQKVFKNLTSLKINNMQTSKIIPPKRSSQIKTKYSAPQLRDYLDPLETLCYVVPLPEIDLDYPEHTYDFMLAYRQFAEN